MTAKGFMRDRVGMEAKVMKKEKKFSNLSTQHRDIFEIFSGYGHTGL